MIFNMFCFFAGAVINANGETQKPLKILSVSGVTNVVLNVIFVTVFHFEIFGVALATIISQVVASVLFAADLLKRRDASRVFIRQIKFHKNALLRILGVGIPTGLQGTLFAASNAVVQASFNSFGTIILAGNAAAGNVDFFVYTVVAAFSQTALTFVSQNMGAKNHHRIKKIILLCCLCTVIDILRIDRCSAIAVECNGIYNADLLYISISFAVELYCCGVDRLANIITGTLCTGDHCFSTSFLMAAVIIADKGYCCRTVILCP